MRMRSPPRRGVLYLCRTSCPCYCRRISLVRLLRGCGRASPLRGSPTRVGLGSCHRAGGPKQWGAAGGVPSPVTGHSWHERLSDSIRRGAWRKKAEVWRDAWRLERRASERIRSGGRAMGKRVSMPASGYLAILAQKHTERIYACFSAFSTSMSSTRNHFLVNSVEVIALLRRYI